MSDKRYSIDLPAHMAECDANYLRLMKLFPSLRDDDVSVFGFVVGDNPYQVQIQVMERGPYTTLVRLTQLPKAPWSTRPGPSMCWCPDPPFPGGGSTALTRNRKAS